MAGNQYTDNILDTFFLEQLSEKCRSIFVTMDEPDFQKFAIITNKIADSVPSLGLPSSTICGVEDVGDCTAKGILHSFSCASFLSLLLSSSSFSLLFQWMLEALFHGLSSFFPCSRTSFRQCDAFCLDSRLRTGRIWAPELHICAGCAP